MASGRQGAGLALRARRSVLLLTLSSRGLRVYCVDDKAKTLVRPSTTLCIELQQALAAANVRRAGPALPR